MLDNKNVLNSLKFYFLNKKNLLIFVIYFLVFGCAILNLNLTLAYKKNLIELKKIYYEKERLLNLQTQLDLEYSNLISFTNLKHFALKNKMSYPDADKIHILKLKND